MSIKRMSAVWEHSEHKGSALLLMLAIADCADNLGVAWPGYNYLAGKIRMGRDSAIRLVGLCDDSGELWKLSRSKQRSNIYIVTVGLSRDELQQAGEKAIKLGVRPPTGSRILRPPPRVLGVVGRSDQVVGKSYQMVVPDLPGGRIAILPDPSLSVTIQEDEDLQELWTQAKTFLKGRMTKATFDAHFHGARLRDGDNGAWRLEVRRAESVAWIERSYRQHVLDALVMAGAEEDRDLEVVGP